MSLNLNYNPGVLVDTENLSREEWLRYRRKGIGGSDAAAVLGLSPFCTKRDLYYDKTGIQAVVDEEEDNWVAKEVGHRLEDLVAEIYARQTGLKVYPIRKMFFHPLYPFMRIFSLSTRTAAQVFWSAKRQDTTEKKNGRVTPCRSIMNIRAATIWQS